MTPKFIGSLKILKDQWFAFVVLSAEARCLVGARGVFPYCAPLASSTAARSAPRRLGLFGVVLVSGAQDPVGSVFCVCVFGRRGAVFGETDGRHSHGRSPGVCAACAVGPHVAVRLKVPSSAMHVLHSV